MTTIAELVQERILAGDAMSNTEAEQLLASEAGAVVSMVAFTRLMAAVILHDRPAMLGSVQHVVHHYPNGKVHQVGIADGMTLGDRI